MATEPARTGFVDGLPVDRILLDTGEATTMVHKALVDPTKLSKATVDIRCAHGDVVSYPTAVVSIRVGKGHSRLASITAGDSRFRSLGEGGSINYWGRLQIPKSWRRW